MAVPLTQMQKKRLERRSSSNITSLLKQYQQQVGAITGEYETAYSDYTKKRTEKLAPYESAVTKYRSEFATYEQQAAAYRKQLTDYTTLLADISKNPLEEVSSDRYKKVEATQPIRLGGMLPKDSTRLEGSQIVFDGQTYDVSANGINIPEGYTYEEGKLYKTRSAEKPGAAPVAPTAPTAPEDIEDFDATQFEEKKAAAEATFKREIGERKSAKLGAVSRKGTRPLLSGATA